MRSNVHMPQLSCRGMCKFVTVWNEYFPVRTSIRIRVNCLDSGLWAPLCHAQLIQIAAPGDRNQSPHSLSDSLSVMSQGPVPYIRDTKKIIDMFPDALVSGTKPSADTVLTIIFAYFYLDIKMTFSWNLLVLAEISSQFLCHPSTSVRQGE